MNRSRAFSYTLMQLALSLYFIVLGIQEVSGSQQSDLVRGVNSLFTTNAAMSSSVQMIIGIIALVSGVLMLLGVFQLVKGRAIDMFTALIFVFWLVRIVYVRFILEMNYLSGTLTFYPNLEEWLLSLSHDILVLCSTFLILRLTRE
ncbi:MAG: hypothetical protein PQJ59_01235 [Spirochaetales bacterium]|nr:hypothetical protein [Spirochaetales bacterium]